MAEDVVGFKVTNVRAEGVGRVICFISSWNWCSFREVYEYNGL
jgi:hypothetical protein